MLPWPSSPVSRAQLFTPLDREPSPEPPLRLWLGIELRFTASFVSLRMCLVSSIARKPPLRRTGPGRSRAKGEAQ